MTADVNFMAVVLSLERWLWYPRSPFFEREFLSTRLLQ